MKPGSALPVIPRGASKVERSRSTPLEVHSRNLRYPAEELRAVILVFDRALENPVSAGGIRYLLQ